MASRWCRRAIGVRVFGYSLHSVQVSAALDREILPLDALALLTLGLLCFAFLWQVALAGRILAGPDAFTYFYPMYEYASARLRSGELPLWDPYLFMGAPFLANPQTGALYPLHWPLIWLPAPTMASAALLVHYLLMLTFVYLLLRLRCSVAGSMAGAVVFGLSGLAGSQAEHFNQIEVLAWLPVQALILERALMAGEPGARRRSGRLGLWLSLAALVSCLQLLAGHTQAVYISAISLAAYALARSLFSDGGRRARAERALRSLAFIASAALLGTAMGAVQLLPTLELARLSVRAGGLPYRQAISFSFGPKAWLLGLLPHFAGEEVFSEYSAHVGVSGLLLATCAVVRQRRLSRLGLTLVLLGLCLALGVYNPIYYVLYRLLPGIALFRVPARWLTLVVLGLALLAADGLASLGQSPVRVRWQWRYAALALPVLAVFAALWMLSQPKPGAITIVGWLATAGGFFAIAKAASRMVRVAGVLALLVAELFFASRSLPYNVATAPSAYYASRRAPQVLAQTGGLYRFLSVSSGRFDAGDMSDLAAFGEGLTEKGRYALLVASKWQEVMARNLALHAGLYGVDGYDGGVLPTQDFVRFGSLFLSRENVALDGRLSERLTGIPPDRLLALASIRYVLRDRIDDVWSDGIYYDLGLPLALAPDMSEATISLPSFPTTSLGLIFSLPPDGAPTEEQELALVEISGTELVVYRVLARASGIVAMGANGVVLQARAVEKHPSLYHLRLPLPQPGYPKSLRLQIASRFAGLTIAGVSLVNDNAGTGVPVGLDVTGAKRAIHYGDVKVYECSDTLPRAYFSPCYRTVPSAGEALAVMREDGWDARQEAVIVSDGQGACAGDQRLGNVTVALYQPERVRLAVDAPTDGYVILTDSYYPGWQATIDGEPTTIVRANYLFRAVPVSVGSHEIEFVYRPQPFRVGAILSGLAIALVAALACSSSLALKRAAP